MNIFFSPYVLEARGPLNSVSHASKRSGALLKICVQGGFVGYADCHPWYELGDLPLQTQLDLLAKEEWTPITRAALEWARRDGEARFAGRSLLDECTIPKSHYLVPDLLALTSEQVDEIARRGFTHVKIKVGRQIEQEAVQLLHLFQHSPLMLRLDFNEVLTCFDFHTFLKQVETLKQHMDFIEDPFPFQPQEWSEVQRQGWKLACDRQALEARQQAASAAVLIVKPAIQSVEAWEDLEGQTCIVTSYLGHPLDQATAAYAAAALDPASNFVHGLLSHHAYQPTSFSRLLNWEGPDFLIPKGVGFGFDQDLQALQWSTLRS